MKALKIWWLKRKARRAYLRVHRILDEYDCGASLAYALSPRLRQAHEDFNDAMNDLAMLDPHTPMFRFERPR